MSSVTNARQCMLASLSHVGRSPRHPDNILEYITTNVSKRRGGGSVGEHFLLANMGVVTYRPKEHPQITQKLDVPVVNLYARNLPFGLTQSGGKCMILAVFSIPIGITQRSN